MVIVDANEAGVAFGVDAQVAIAPEALTSSVGSVARQKVTLETFEPFALTVPLRTAVVPVTAVAGSVFTIGAPVLKERTAP